MKRKEQFTAACQALGKNDPRRTQLNLAYGSLLDRKNVQQLVKALEKSTFLEDVTLSSKNLSMHSTLQLSHFLRTSPSLRCLEMRSEEQYSIADEEIDATKAYIVFESISRNTLLVKLTLQDVVFGDECPLEGFLSSTRTLQDFSYIQTYSTMMHQVAQAIGRGLAQNKSLVKLKWDTLEDFLFVEEILFGLSDHIGLKTLELNIGLTKSSSQALRSLLHYNGTLERLALKQRQCYELIPTMVSVLAGLAQNTGLKEVLFEAEDSFATNATLATAWTNMLQKNTSIKVLDFRNTTFKQDADRELCSAVAEGLAANSTLETLYLPGWSEPEVFQGPVWQEMLKSNRCLKKLCFSDSSVSLEAFQSLARGLSHNTSLESFDLSSTTMSDPDIVALAKGIRTNKTLKYLNLSTNGCGLRQSGRAAIQQLIGYNILRELIVAGTPASIGAFGLSANHSLEKLDLESSFVDGEEYEIFHALCESLRGNTTLKYLSIANNGVHLDGVCATALKLGTMSLETLVLNGNTFTWCGIAALAEGLQGPCTLKELCLKACGLDDTDLLKLGRALTFNVSLEVLDVRESDCSRDGANQFFELLPQMKGLKTVYGLVIMGDEIAPPKALRKVLVDSLRQNTRLQKIFADDDGATVDSYFTPGAARVINFFLGLNRHGRMLLQPPGGSEIPSGLWPRVLAKIAGPRDMSLLFYFLQSKPKLVKCNPPTIRKRKAIETTPGDPCFM
jgi:Ran GTPase-activating protein (RanGAP) involved in mRNA processing and transport